MSIIYIVIQKGVELGYPPFCICLKCLPDFQTLWRPIQEINAEYFATNHPTSTTHSHTPRTKTCYNIAQYLKLTLKPLNIVNWPLFYWYKNILVRKVSMYCNYELGLCLHFRCVADWGSKLSTCTLNRAHYTALLLI